jgi:hypothetical protein
MNDVRDINGMLTHEFTEAVRAALGGLPRGEWWSPAAVGYEKPLAKFHPFTSRDITDALYDLEDAGQAERHEFDHSYRPKVNE